MTAGAGVSVVIPTYNRGHVLGGAIESALAQEWKPLEVIVVDDGSTDMTASLLDAHSERHRRLRVVTLRHNGGASAARNAGVQVARHDYVAFLDSDNRFMPGKLARQMPGLLAGPESAVGFTGYVLEDSYRTVPVLMSDWAAEPNAVVHRLLESCCVNTSTFVARRQLLLAEGRFRVDLVCCEDHELWLRLAGTGHPFLYVAEPLTRYHFHAHSLSANEVCVAESSELVIAEFLSRSDLGPQLRRREREYRSRWALNAAVRYLAADERPKARSALLRAAITRPASVRPGWIPLALRAFQR